MITKEQLSEGARKILCNIEPPFNQSFDTAEFAGLIEKAGGIMPAAEVILFLAQRVPQGPLGHLSKR